MLSLYYRVTGLARKLLGNRVGRMRRMSTIDELREEVRNRSNAPQGNAACQVRLCRVTFKCGHHHIRFAEAPTDGRSFSCRKLPTRKEDVCRVWQTTMLWTGHRL